MDQQVRRQGEPDSVVRRRTCLRKVDRFRYALIVSPKTIQSTALAWCTTTGTVSGAKTRWDGLSATNALVAATGTYPAAEYCAAQTAPSDGASAWYLPALDELEVLFRRFKPGTETNYLPSQGGGSFPGGTFTKGANPSSDPTGNAYTTTNPAQTGIAEFQYSAGAQYLGTTGNYVPLWSSTEFDTSAAWAQHSRGLYVSWQTNYPKTYASTPMARPVRRLYLDT